jgi:hypothetical protein
MKSLDSREVATHSRAVGPSLQERKAPWLQCAYSSHVWTVSDTWNANRTAVIDFNFALADGRSLVDAPRLYATVKEYAFYIRDDRYAAVDDAKTHVGLVRNLMFIAHALSLRKMFSFNLLQPYDLAEIVDECRFGADAVIHASQRVEAYLDTLSKNSEAAKSSGREAAPFGGIPRRVTSRGETKIASVGAIVAACHLPTSAAYFPSIATLVAKAAKATGLRKKNGKADLDDIRPTRNVTVQAMQRWLAPIEQLYAMRARIEAESVSFKPFPQGASRVAIVKGVGTERTPTPPPKLALFLLEKSAQEIYAHRKQSIDLLNRAEITHLATACWIVIAAFSARRDQEIDDLRVGCLRGDPASGHWLHVYIEKTLQRKEWIPVPELVAQAISILERISAQARLSSNSDYLFQWRSEDGTVFRLDLGRQLDAFATAVGVPLHRDGGEDPVAWHWHPHQFRRFFAILYFYRFDGASIESLSYFLRHFSLEMTKRYVTQDPEVAAIWTDVEWGYMGHIARSICAGDRAVAGGAGERLKRLAKGLIDLFRRRLQVVTPERIGASLLLLMQRNGLVLTPKPWVTCTCPHTSAAAARAACRQQADYPAGAVGPDFANAGPTVCSSCPHAITDQRCTEVVDDELKHLSAVAESEPRAGTIFGELEAARVIELHRVKNDRYEGAKPLQYAM